MAMDAYLGSRIDHGGGALHFDLPVKQIAEERLRLFSVATADLKMNYRLRHVEAPCVSFLGPSARVSKTRLYTFQRPLRIALEI